MSVDPDLRITLGFILALRAVLAISLSGILTEAGIHQELRRLRARDDSSPLLVWSLLVLPLLAFLCDAHGIALLLAVSSTTASEYSSMWLPDALRWLLLIPSLGGLLLGIWVRRCPMRHSEAASQEPRDRRWSSGPYRLVRFPDWAADILLFGSMLLATSQWLAVASFVVACWVLEVWHFPRAERAWRQLLGDEYDEYAMHTGRLIPKFLRLKNDRVPEYSVPKRFGMSAIIALVTMFAVMFGILNAAKSEITEFDLPLTVHLFFGSLLMLVWMAQMRFAQSARRASVVVGAILMPAFVLLSLGRVPPPAELSLALVLLCSFGGVIGYCMGALAAGLFLVADWLGPFLPGSRRRETTS